MPTKSLYAIYGVSGFGREVMPVARAMLLGRGDHESTELVFVDDKPELDQVNGHRVLTYERFLAIPGEKRVNVAIADSSIREKIAAQCRADGVPPFSVIAVNAVVMDDVALGDGAILQPFVTLTSNIAIGRHFQANIYSYVAHDCVIGDFVTFAPGVKCNGNVTVEDHAYVGAGAVLRQGKTREPLVIGRGAIVGMGAVVTKNVPAGATVVGNPARPLLKS